MARVLRAAVLLFLVGLLSGCGTVANLAVGAREGWKNTRIYGGLTRDVQTAGNWIDHSWTWGKNLNIQQDIGTVVGVVLVGIDMPLSVIGDTLTLPITIPLSLSGTARNDGNVRRVTAANSPAAASSR